MKTDFFHPFPSPSPLASVLGDWTKDTSPFFKDWTRESLVEALVALGLSFLLNCLIAWVYKRTYRGTKYSQDYVHTLVLLGTVVTLVILVVQGSQSTAFGMFAAFSIIRFRSAVGQARDIGFIFLAMASGMAVGARAYGIAVAVTPVICALVWFLSWRDAFAPRRLSHILRIRVTHEINYDTAFAPAFSEYLSFHNLDSVETVQAGMMSELKYSVTLKRPDTLSAFMQRIQTLNGNNRVLMTSTGNTLPVEV